MANFTEKPAFEIARSIEIRGADSFAWFAIMPGEGESDEALANFAADLNAGLAVQPRVVSVRGLSPTETIALLRSPLTDIVILMELDAWGPADWSAFDINRSGFNRPGAIVLWTSPLALTSLCQLAPNIRSFVGGSIYPLGADGGAMTESEAKVRIQELESHYGLASTDVVAKAECGELPPEPHFAEWLILLGRGDLV